MSALDPAAETDEDLPNSAAVLRMNDLVRPHIRYTPVVQVAGADIGASNGLTVPVTLKLEQLQCSGSFKARGAFANLLDRDVPASGVIAASGGNHGVAVAYAAARLGVHAHIFVPTVSNPQKIERIRQLGADLVVKGERYSDALAVATEFASQSQAISIHAYDQRETIAGQGTIAVELAEQAPQVDTVLVPVGGGGLIAGIAAFFGNAVRIVGVEPSDAPTLAHARAAGGPVDAPTGSVAADALAPQRYGELTFRLAQAYVDDVILVDDDAIVDAQNILWHALRVIAEPAAAVAVAALRTCAYRPRPDEHVAVVITGANTAASAPAG